MIALQHRWYNCLIDALSLDPSMLQLVQPAAPVAPADQALWDFLDVIPPASLTFNPRSLVASRMFDQYAAMVSQAEFPMTTLEQVMGERNFQAWSAYLATLSPTPADDQLPALVQAWTARTDPGVAAASVAFFSRRVFLDAALQALTPYQGPDAQPADFVGTYADAARLLGASPGCEISFDSSVISENAKQTWTDGRGAGTDGLWTGSGGDSRLSCLFAASRVRVSARFNAHVQWTATPGPWYNSSLFNTLFSSRTTPPWRAEANPSWSDLFRPDGSMRRLVASLLLADGGTITVTSDAVFDPEDQRAILDHARLGVWPFYAPTSSAVSNAVTFPRSGGMEIAIVTQPGNPLLIGTNVLGVGRYLGHAD